MNGNIEHIATVIAVDDGVVTVEMEVVGGCASCRVKSACGMSEGNSKLAQVKTADAQKYSVGDRVTISIERGMGIKAILIAYVFPLLVLIGSLLVMIGIGLDEIVAGLFSMGLMCIYFVIVFVLRKQIEEEIIFKITKL